MSSLGSNMSEFPEWVERRVFGAISSTEARELHTQIQQGLWPDPRGTKKPVGYRYIFPWLNRRRSNDHGNKEDRDNKEQNIP